MSISTETAVELYTGNDATTSFPVNFKINDASHLEVVKRDADGVETTLVLDTDYEVSGVGDDTCTVTYPKDEEADPLASGESLAIRRKPPFTQLTNFENQGGFFPETHTDVADYLTMLILFLKEELERCPKADLTSGETGAEIMDSIDASVEAAEAAQAAAEAAVTDAETAQGLAEDAQEAAEEARDDAQTAQQAAQQAANTFEAASKEEAEAGAILTKYMPPLRVLQSINANKVRVGTGSISAGALAIDASLYDVINLTANDNFTLNIPTNGQAGQRVTVRITQDGTGSRELTLHENFLIASELSTDGVVLSTAAGAIDKIGLYCVDGSTWEVEAFSTDFAQAV